MNDPLMSFWANLMDLTDQEQAMLQSEFIEVDDRKARFVAMLQAQSGGRYASILAKITS